MTFFDLPKKRTLKAWPQLSVASGWTRVVLSPAILPLAASLAPPPSPVALTPMAQLNRLDRPPTLGPLLLPKYQYDAGKWAQKEQALADWIRLVGKWLPSCWVGAMVMNFLVWDPPLCFLNTFASSCIDVNWAEACHTSHGWSQVMLDDPPACLPMVQHPCSADFCSVSIESECSLARSFWHPDLSIGPLGPAPLHTTMATASRVMLDDPPALALGPAPLCAPKDAMNVMTMVMT